MRLLCIDPGLKVSGVVLYCLGSVEESYPSISNMDLIKLIKANVFRADFMAIEMIAGMGLRVGADVFETCCWVGRFIQAFKNGQCHAKVYRKDVKLYLCGNSRAKDPEIRRAVLDMFPTTGGGKTPQIGTKKNPGPLYGVGSHAMSALAVGITFIEDYCLEES